MYFTCANICTYMYIYIYISLYNFLCGTICTRIYIYIYTHIYIYIFFYWHGGRGAASMLKRFLCSVLHMRCDECISRLHNLFSILTDSTLLWENHPLQLNTLLLIFSRYKSKDNKAQCCDNQQAVTSKTAFQSRSKHCKPDGHNTCIFHLF